MAFLLLISMIICIFSSQLVEGLQIGALVKIDEKDVKWVFLEEELFGVYNRTKNNILTIEVVIDSKRLIDIKSNKKTLSFKIIHPDYSVVIRKERERINNRTVWKRGMPFDWFFEEFRPWAQYLLFLAEIEFEYSDLVKPAILGQTFEGNNIPLMALTPDATLDPSKPGFYIQASVHSNEWLANAATAFVLKELCEGFYNDDNIYFILNNINIFIVPTVNIDGYQFTWSDTRNWRKNRRNNPDGTMGVDLNRNYYGPQNTWNTVGVSGPSGNNYPGPAFFSEPETQAIRDFITNQAAYNIRAAVDMHTTGPYILWPLGWTTTAMPQPDYSEYVSLGDNMQEAAAINGQTYTSIQSSLWYLTSGTMHDYMWYLKNETGYGEIKGFTFEGRPIGSGEPPIVQAGEEQLAGLLYLARSLISD